MMNHTLTEIKPPLFDFLHAHQLMAISTFYHEPWIANVYYAVDEELNLYFVSKPESIHCQHIVQQPLVACSVYDSTQTPIQQATFSKKGVQLSGFAELLTVQSEIETGLTLWKQSLNIHTSEYFSVENMLSKKITQKVWKVKPSKVRFFNEELFNEKHVPLFTLE